MSEAPAPASLSLAAIVGAVAGGHAPLASWSVTARRVARRAVAAVARDGSAAVTSRSLLLTGHIPRVRTSKAWGQPPPSGAPAHLQRDPAALTGRFTRPAEVRSEFKDCHPVATADFVAPELFKRSTSVVWHTAVRQSLLAFAAHVAAISTPPAGAHTRVGNCSRHIGRAVHLVYNLPAIHRAASGALSIDHHMDHQQSSA
jgi:hypothetical protein